MGSQSQNAVSAARTRFDFSSGESSSVRDSSICTQGSSDACELVIQPPLKGSLRETDGPNWAVKQRANRVNQGPGNAPPASLRQTSGRFRPGSGPTGGPVVAIVWQSTPNATPSRAVNPDRRS